MHGYLSINPCHLPVYLSSSSYLSIHAYIHQASFNPASLRYLKRKGTATFPAKILNSIRKAAPLLHFPDWRQPR